MMMMMNLFSTFDINMKNHFIPLMWTLMMMMILISLNLKTIKINFNLPINQFMIKSTKQSHHLKSINLMMITTLTLTLTMNLMNLLPFYLSPTSNIIFNLSLTMILWSTNLTLMMMNNINLLMMNLTPSKTPLPLMLIINLIELNSFIFQIISLSMRLTINMMMSHIIISISMNLLTASIQLTIETFIIFIQSYVFLTLNMMNFNNSF